MKKTYSAAIIGCGKLGLPCGEVMAKYYDSVVGYDVKGFNSKILKKGHDLQHAITNKQFIFISVPTPHDRKYGGETPAAHLPPKDFCYKEVRNVLQGINKFLKPDQIVVLISTVLPGTVRNKLYKLIPNNTLIYNPYLIAMGTVKYDMQTPECIIIGSKDGKKTSEVKRLISFYKQIVVNNPIYHCGTWEEAECIKIFYNTFISFKISFANMILDVAQTIKNTNVDVVTNAIKNATNRIISPAYLTAGMGDGGACHPRDNIALRFLAKKLNLGYDIFQSIVQSRDGQAKNFAKFIKKQFNKYKLPVIFYGKTYKPGVPLIDGSYSLLVASFLKLKIRFIDPLLDQNTTVNTPSLFILCHPYEIKTKYCNIPKGSVVIDPWRTLSYIKGCTIIQYGNTRFMKEREDTLID